MNEQRDFEQVLRAHFEARAERTVMDGQLATILDRTVSRRQRPAWLAALRSPSMSASSIAARPAIPRAAWLLLPLSASSLAWRSWPPLSAVLGPRSLR